ncbi:MAG: hypothetical protein CO143_00255 [Candidatus Moranbacteria bacterium CG_4_9_14_3_um_filter_45_14]|nr:MAG: hypothetical protein CO143_00255 [Candidatus Moranbacteria bacterium CG_4_9_14_3_um_filter_45_14]
MSKKINLLELSVQARQLIGRRFKRIKKILNRKVNLPPLEDVLFIFLFLFSATFGALLFGIGEKIKNEKPAVMISYNYVGPNKMEKKIETMVADHPIEKMAPYISYQKKDVAAYLVAIAKKESNWGKFSPQKDGETCYNYWGYRGTYNQTRSGYSCFDSPEQAVEVVGERISELIDQDIDTPEEMVVWKCGHACSSHSAYSVAKWIQDVDLYYRKF